MEPTEIGFVLNLVRTYADNNIKLDVYKEISFIKLVTAKLGNTVNVV